MLAASAFAGQSVELGPHFLYAGNAIPNSPTNRMEFYIHDWSTTGAGTHIVNSGATGWLGYLQVISPTNVILYFYNTWETGGQAANIEIGALPQRAVYLRCQHDPVNKLDLIEAWDLNGNRISSNSLSYVSEKDTGTDFQMGYGGEPALPLAFMRVHSSLVPLNSRPPVTSDNSNRIFEWKFDGDLSDASGNGHTAIVYQGTPAYVQTPYQNTIAVVKTAGANSWTNVVTQRAGYPAMMDGTASYSQADGSSAITCSWAATGGPSTLIWDNTKSCTPVIQGLIFGDYTVALTVTSAANGTTATVSTEFGAVAMDDNGVVVNADPNVDAIFGPMIAYGKNPWGFADYWTLHAMNLRVQNAYPGWGLNTSPQWENVGSGTVTYYWNGIGGPRGPNATAPPGTALSSGISQTARALTVKDASQLDLSELPTRVLLLTSFSNVEEIRICSASGNTLTVCYDGRGQNAQSWNTGALVLQDKVKGSGTRFLTDASAPVCPLGAPGPPGPASYSAGSVGLTAGSTTMTGVGTNWSPATGAVPNYFVRVSATHGGVPFQFIAQIVSVQPGAITLNRPYPADADSRTYSSYAIMPASRTVVLRYNDLYNTTTPPRPLK